MTKQTQPRKKSRMVTKEDIKTVLTLWEENTLEDIAKKLNTDKQHIQYLANQIRKAGGKLSKKSATGYLRSLITEVLREQK